MNRRFVATVGALVLIATTTVVVGAFSPTASAACSSVQFVGVRGSGEPQGFGNTIASTLTAFKAANKSSNSSYALDYPAARQPFLNKDATTQQFIQSVGTGVTNLNAYLAQQSTQCSTQRFVIAGYSQGALVTDLTLAAAPANIQSRVIGVALIGDPIFDPASSFDVGTFDHGRKGVIKEFLPWLADNSALPASLQNHTRSYCLAGDPVCNYGIVNLYKCFQNEDAGTCPHQQYITSGYTAAAGRYLASAG